MPEAAPPPGTACVVLDCDRPATLYVQVPDPAAVDDDSSIAMCDKHAAHWRDGDINY